MVLKEALSPLLHWGLMQLQVRKNQRSFSTWSRVVAGALAGFFAFAPLHAYADESQRIFRSAYFLGRGDAGIANADNHEALFYNPAGLALGDGIYKETVLISPHLEVSAATKDLVRQIAIEKQNDPKTLAQYQGKNQHLGLYNFTGVVFRRAALGAIVSNQTNILVKKNPEQASLQSVSADTVANTGLVFGLAESFFKDYFLVGFTYKYLMRTEAGVAVNLIDAQDAMDDMNQEEMMRSATGSALDLGLMWRIPTAAPISFGLQVENVGGAKLAGNSQKDRDITLKQTVNLGLSFEPGTRFSKFRLFMDYRDVLSAVETNTLKKIHLGSELNVLRFLGVTGGLNQGYPTVGFYVNTYVLRFDMGAYAEEMGDRVGTRPDVRYFFRLAAGF